MRNPIHLIRQYSHMTGIRDPKVDAWFGNQSLYLKHGMEHPALERRREPERRSRSPMLPGPRSTKSLDEQLFDKWMDDRYPEMMFPRHTYSDYITNWRESSWWQSSVFCDDKETFFLVDDDWNRHGRKPRGYGVISGIRPWDDREGTYTYRTDGEAQEAVFRIEAEARYQAMLRKSKELQDAALKRVLDRGFKFKWEERSEDDEGADGSEA